MRQRKISKAVLFLGMRESKSVASFHSVSKLLPGRCEGLQDSRYHVTVNCERSLIAIARCFSLSASQYGCIVSLKKGLFFCSRPVDAQAHAFCFMLTSSCTSTSTCTLLEGIPSLTR